MRKENLKRKDADDTENGSDNEEQENSPAAADKDEDTEMPSANENTEENGDSKEPGTDEEFEDAETGDDKDAKKSDAAKDKEKETDDEDGKNGEDKGEEEDDVPLKKGGRGKPKPNKKAVKETNGDSVENGDGKDEENGDGDEEEDEDAEENNAEEDKEEADSDYESGSKKTKKGTAGKRGAPKKKVSKKAKPKPAKKSKKEEVEEDEEEDDEEEYEVQEIVDHRKERGGKMVYRIRWKNFGAKDDTWEPESTLSCPDIIKRYKAKIAKEEKKKEEEEDDDEEEEYEVQEIIDHRKERGGKMVYRIRWKNFSAKDDTWEPEATLSCPDIIKRYKAKIEKEDSAPPTKKGKPGPKESAKKGAAGKKDKPKAPPKKRATREESEDEEDEDEDDTEYEVEKIIEVHFKRNGQREYLVRWKGFSSKDDTWEPEDNLHCKDLIEKFNEKLEKTKNATVKELRMNRKQPERLNLSERGHKTSKRNAGKVRVNYYDGE
ncbi:ABC transporter F family member 4-like [Armigeres subalbatus]|uniref:ABC transporter F family member 4-like n=1 Tax=Armigeres subalbatus TaxID=124917 RepID=UPI002ED04526